MVEGRPEETGVGSPHFDRSSEATAAEPTKSAEDAAKAVEDFATVAEVANANEAAKVANMTEARTHLVKIIEVASGTEFSTLLISSVGNFNAYTPFGMGSNRRQHIDSALDMENTIDMASTS